VHGAHPLDRLEHDVGACCYPTTVAERSQPNPSPRARPITEISVDVLLARADQLARNWAIALILARAAEEIGEIPLEELSREAPVLCAQALRAVCSEVELERLSGRAAQPAPAGGSRRERPAPADRLAAIVGTYEAAALVGAVEALRGVLWTALLAEVHEPPARLAGDLGDRLAHVCSTMLAAALEADAATLSRPPGEQALEAAVPSSRARAKVPVPGGRAVIVDERLHMPASAVAAAAPERPFPTHQAPAGDAGEGAVEIEIRDQRGGEGPTAWIRSIGAQLERLESDGRPFAVLLVELLELERMRREESPDELMLLSARMEQALAGALPSTGADERSGSLTRERPGRCWLVVPGLDGAGAATLAQRLAIAVASIDSDRRAPLAVVIGTAVCPDDGRRAATLAAHADVGLYAARSAARTGLSAG